MDVCIGLKLMRYFFLDFSPLYLLRQVLHLNPELFNQLFNQLSHPSNLSSAFQCYNHWWLPCQLFYEFWESKLWFSYFCDKCMIHQIIFLALLHGVKMEFHYVSVIKVASNNFPLNSASLHTYIKPLMCMDMRPVEGDYC